MIAPIAITGINYDVDDKTRKYVEEKIGKLDKYVPSHARKTLTASVKLQQVNRDHGNKYEVEVIIHVPDKIITAKDSTLNIMAATDIVEAKLIAQLRKYKDSLLSQRVVT